MSLHQPSPSGKPRRIGLYVPFVLLLIAVVAWTGFWLWTRGEARTRMDAAVADLRAAGYEVSWKERTLGGYPFRMDVTVTEAQVRDPSGWALEAPRLEGEAFMHGLNHWILAAPEGFTFVRPIAGRVTVSGRLIRASVGDFGKRPPSFSFQGMKLAFRPGPGAQPFALIGADLLEFHLRAGPDDEGGVFGKVDKGVPTPGGMLAAMGSGAPVSIVWNSTLSKMSAFAGPDWPGAVRAWSAAGGAIHVREAALSAGGPSLSARDGNLRVGPDGRLLGSLDVSLRQAPQALAALAQARVIPPESAAAGALVVMARQGSGDAAKVTVTFQAGRTTLGPVALGPAPAVYQRR